MSYHIIATAKYRVRIPGIIEKEDIERFESDFLHEQESTREYFSHMFEITDEDVRVAVETSK